MKINNATANYNNLFVYDENGIIYKTSRPNDIDIELHDIEIRTARKENFKKGDFFEMKSQDNGYRCFANGKDLYIPSLAFELVKKEEVLHHQHDGEKDFKDVYTFKIKCKANKYTKHVEKVTDLPKDMQLSEYDPNGKFGGGFSKTCNMYDISENFKTKETYVVKKWLTYDVVEELTLESDCYTRIEKDENRNEREEIANILEDCLFSGSVSHFEVARMLEKLNITIK